MYQVGWLHQKGSSFVIIAGQRDAVLLYALQTKYVYRDLFVLMLSGDKTLMFLVDMNLDFASIFTDTLYKMNSPFISSDQPVGESTTNCLFIHQMYCKDPKGQFMKMINCLESQANFISCVPDFLCWYISGKRQNKENYFVSFFIVNFLDKTLESFEVLTKYKYYMFSKKSILNLTLGFEFF